MLQCCDAATVVITKNLNILLLTSFLGLGHQNANACDALAVANEVTMGYLGYLIWKLAAELQEDKV